MYYDVAIVGAGPAGSSLAAQISSSGLHAVIIDKQDFPRNKLCGGMLTSKTIDLITHLFPRLTYDSYSIRLVDVLYKQSRLLSFVPVDILKIIDRFNFDYELVKYAQHCGAAFMPASTIKEIDFSSRIIETVGSNLIRYGILVGADGAHSYVRRKLGLPKNNMGFCVQVSLPYATSSAIERDFNKEKAEIFFGEFEQGYLWRFPLNTIAVVGTGAIVSSMEGKPILQVLKDFIQLNYAIPEYKIRGAHLPSGNSIELGDLKSNTCLIGDAAGLIDPITGEGLYFALYSSSMLANVLAHCPSHLVFEAYQHKMSQVIKRINNDCQLRNVLYEPPLLAQTLQTLSHVPEYAEELIHSTVCTYQRSYESGLDELRDLLR